MADAVDTIRNALSEHARGTLVAPPRFSVDGDGGSLVFTAGAATERGAIGFRVYETFPEDSPEHTQLVVVFDGETGAFRGLVVGDVIGRMRTGAIGGVAVDELARSDATTVAVLGSGNQARTQLRGATAVRDIDSVRVYSPTAANRETFAEEMRAGLGLSVVAVDDPETAVRDADVVLCTTRSESPVFEAEWLAPGAHVTTVGPKFENAHELSREVVDRAAIVATDSRAQVDGYADYKRPFFLDDAEREAMVELGELVVGDVTGRRDGEDVTVYCSVGLAGTEVVLGDEVLSRRG